MNNFNINEKVNPKGLKKDEPAYSMSRRPAGRYDAVIIGAGIGGLTCGYYLAKTGKIYHE